MLSKKSALIIEDEVLIATHLKTILASYKCKEIVLAHTKEKALKALNTFEPDIILLDINLENKYDGLEIADYINTHQKKPFIFITAYSDALTLSKAIVHQPAAYITKPFKQTDVLAAIQLTFINNSNLNQEYLIIKNQNGSYKINTNTITHIESIGNYITIHTTTQKHTLRNPLNWAIDKLPQDVFIKTHRAFIVNLNFVTKLSSQEIKINEISIPLTRMYKDKVFEKYHG